jgi:hypothetical protein
MFCLLGLNQCLAEVAIEEGAAKVRVVACPQQMEGMHPII